MAAAYSALLLVACSLAPLESPRFDSIPFPHDPSTPNLLREHYVPREGDMIFFTYYKKIWYIIFKLGHTGPPYHVALVVRTPEGELKLLEAGSLQPTSAMLVDIMPRVVEYQGLVHVRSLCQPITPEQSQILTCFTQEQLGKKFAKVRVGLDGLSNRKLSTLRYCLQGPAPVERDKYYCSELVVSVLIAAGVLPYDFLIPNPPFPRDLYLSCPRPIEPWYCPPVHLICAP
jgi:hypothetical protein